MEKILFLFLLAFLTFVISIGFSDIITIYAIEDTYTSQEHPDANYGNSTKLYIAMQGSSANDEKRILLKFNISEISSLDIQDVNLSLFQKSGGTSKGGYPLYIKPSQLNPINATFDEDNTTWETMPAWTGTFGDCYFGDYSHKCNVAQHTEGREISWNITKWFKNRVNENYKTISFYVKSYTGETTPRNCIFNSRESGSNTVYPRITISYTPLPSTSTTTTTTTTTLPAFERPILLTNNDFWNILFASSLGYPTLVWNDTNDFTKQRQKKFIENYEPDVVFTLGVDYPAYLPVIRSHSVDKNSLKDYFPGQGRVIIDDNKTNAILSASIAKMMNYSLVMTDGLSPDDFNNSICDFYYDGCGTVLENEDELLNYLLNLTEQNKREVRYIVAANANHNESALAPKFSDAVPVPFSINENYSGNADEANENNKIHDVVKKINLTVDKIGNKKLLGRNYLFNQTLFLALLGMPYPVVRDPWDDDNWYLSDGEMLFTDNLYGDINGDGYIDLATGRFCCSPAEISLQIENAKTWNRKINRSLILSEYRLPKYLDLFAFGGMTQGFTTDWVLRSSGFETKRFVENRLEQVSENDIQNINEEFDFSLTSPEYWIGKAFDFLKLKKFVKFKYALLEYNWPEPEKLPDLTDENFLNNKDFAPLIFYFGMGNLDNWFLPSETDERFFTPYPGDINITPENFNFSEPKILFDEHSLSGHPESSFIRFNDLAYIGSTGIVHDTITGPPLLIFLRNIVGGNSLGKAVQNMKYVNVNNITSETNKKSPITSATAMSGLKLMQKESYQKILYGDPGIVIDPLSTASNEYVVDADGENLYVRADFNLSYDLINYTVGNKTYTDVKFESPDDYLYDYGKPVVPVFRKEMILPANISVSNVSIEITPIENLTLDPLLLQPDQFTDKTFGYSIFPKYNCWVDIQELLDGRSKLIINFAPVKYFNGTKSATIYNMNFSIKYESPLEILELGVSNKNITMGENQAFDINLKADGYVNLSLLISGENFTCEINETEFVNGTKNISIAWAPDRPGNFLAMLVAASDGLVAGPKEINFTVGEVPMTTTTIVPESATATIPSRKPFRKSELTSPKKIERETIRIFERAYFMRDKGKEIFIYQNPRESIRIENTYNNITKTFTTPYKRLKMFSDPTVSRYELTTPDGKIIKTMSNGNAVQDCWANCDMLSDELDAAIAYYNELASALNEKINSGELSIG